MREIKFRAWDKDECKMIPFSHIWFELEDGYGGVKERISETIPAEFREVQEFVLMQYTGLYDKNGVEIYEGDIVNQQIHFGTESRTPKNKPFVHVPGVVAWGSDGWIVSHEMNREQYWESVKGNSTDWYRVTYGWCSVEVIGNIYENPELLNKDGDAK